MTFSSHNTERSVSSLCCCVCLSFYSETLCALQVLEVLPVIETARKCVHELRAAGAQVVIALTHLPFSHKETVTDQQLMREVPGIDLLLGGHDHFFMVSSI